MNILRSKLGLKILILVSEHNVRNVESPNYVRAKLRSIDSCQNGTCALSEN